MKPIVAFDLWSSNGIGLLGGTVHGILRPSESRAEEPDQSWVLKSKLAGAAPCGKLRHTSEHIRSEYDSMVNKLGIEDPIEEIFMAVLDGASNGQKAMADRDSMWCNVHKLQCSINKFRNHASMKPTLSRARGTVGHFNHSTIAKIDLKTYMAECGLEPHNLTQDIEVRWCTMLAMIEDLLDSREPIALYDVRSKTPGDAYKSNKLTYEDWRILEETKWVMEPASDGTALLEADEYITSSLVLPTIFKIIHQANPQTPIIVPALDGDIEMNGSSYKAVNNEDLTDVVQEAREEYYADLVDRWESNLDLATKKFLFIAMQCDPRFKSMSSLPGLSDEDKAEARAWFKTEYAIHWKPQPSEPQPEPSEPQPEQPSAQPTLNLR